MLNDVSYVTSYFTIGEHQKLPYSNYMSKYAVVGSHRTVGADIARFEGNGSR